jgi:hypothetical protein
MRGDSASIRTSSCRANLRAPRQCPFLWLSLSMISPTSSNQLLELPSVNQNQLTPSHRIEFSDAMPRRVSGHIFDFPARRRWTLNHVGCQPLILASGRASCHDDHCVPGIMEARKSIHHRPASARRSQPWQIVAE